MKKIIAIFLMMPLLLISAVSCQKETAPQQCGILMNGEEVSYSEQTRETARAALTSLFTRYAEKQDKLKARAVKDRIPTYTEGIENVFFAEGIKEERYLAFFESITEREETVADLIDRMGRGTLTTDDRDEISDLFALMTDTFGSSAYDGVLRGLCNCRYDFEIEDNEKRAETYKNTTALFVRYTKLAEEAKNKKKIFNGIDGETFSTVVKTAVLFAGTLTSESFEPELIPLDSFTDEEVCALVRALGGPVSLSVEEWMTLCDLASGFDMMADFLRAVERLGDQETLGKALNDYFSFLERAKNGLRPETVAVLRETEKSEWPRVIVSAFDTETKEALSSLSAADFREKDYRDVIATYGELRDFFTCETHTADELYTCEADELPDVAKGILRGMFYD